VFAQALAEGFSGLFDLKSKLSKKSFLVFVGTLAGVFVIAHVLASAAGTGVNVAINAIFVFPFISTFWRRKNDAGVTGWFSMFWLVPVFISAIGAIVGPPVPKPVPAIDPGLGDAGLFLFLTPQFGNAASVSIENSTNQLIYDATYTVLPGLLFVALLVIEIIFCVRPSSTGKGR
jgi:uncharacterized membrane protein YhaH (DUF805 family)